VTALDTKSKIFGLGKQARYPQRARSA